MKTRLLALPSPEDEDRERVVSQLIGLLFAGIWLVFLLEPIAAGWAARSSRSGLVGFVAVIAFAGVYLLHFVATRAFAFGGIVDGRPVPSPRGRWLRYAVLVALSSLGTLALGQPGTATWAFVAVAGLWTMPARWAFTIGLGLIAAYEVLVRVVDGWSRHTGVSLSIAMAMLAVGAGMLTSRRSRDLFEARRENARLAVEEERGRLARDIHDILGHSLTVITVKAELAGRLLEMGESERAAREVAAVEALAREALADVRGAVVGVREISLAGELARARAALSAAGIEAALPSAIESVEPALKELFAWTVREAVTNVVRHSGASRCDIIVAPEAIRVRDDGVGGRGHGGGSGLRGLRERARLVGAIVTTRAVDPHGFEIQVSRAK